jgi:hypothetical protein
LHLSSLLTFFCWQMWLASTSLSTFNIGMAKPCHRLTNPTWLMSGSNTHLLSNIPVDHEIFSPVSYPTWCRTCLLCVFGWTTNNTFHLFRLPSSWTETYFFKWNEHSLWFSCKLFMIWRHRLVNFTSAFMHTPVCSLFLLCQFNMNRNHLQE